MQPEEQDTYYGEMKKITNNGLGRRREQGGKIQTNCPGARSDEEQKGSG
jgi:hypothetical protein